MACEQLRIGGIAACLLLLSGCEGKLAGMEDNELQDRMHACRTTTNQAPGFAISCDNYKRECDRRRKEGRFVC